VKQTEQIKTEFDLIHINKGMADRGMGIHPIVGKIIIVIKYDNTNPLARIPK